MSIQLEFPSPCGDYELAFEDDGKVAYAYLKKGDEIVGEVWLYNRHKAPHEPEWGDNENAPFANPAEYVAPEAHYTQDVGEDDVAVRWDDENDAAVAYVYVHDDLLGVIAEGDRPGHSRFAIKDGPLGQTMESE